MEYKLKAFCISALLILLQVNEIFAESGYELWLRYHLIEDVALKRYYQIKTVRLFSLQERKNNWWQKQNYIMD